MCVFFFVLGYVCVVWVGVGLWVCLYMGVGVCVRGKDGWGWLMPQTKSNKDSTHKSRSDQKAHRKMTIRSMSGGMTAGLAPRKGSRTNSPPSPSRLFKNQ